MLSPVEEKDKKIKMFLIKKMNKDMILYENKKLILE